jgi:hypothetical protein
MKLFPPFVYGPLVDLGFRSFATRYPDVTMREWNEYDQAGKALTKK